MKGRRKSRVRVVFGSGALATLAVCTASCVQTPYYAMASPDGSRAYEISIFSGNLCIESQPGPPPRPGWHHYAIGRQTEPFHDAWLYASAHTQLWGYSSNKNQPLCLSGFTPPFVVPIHRWLVIPLWLPMALWAGFIVGRRAINLQTGDARFVAGQCSDCGYDLTGNTSGVCPECGQAVE